ncbi:MAG: ROK family protein [Planctomycetota bacterium]|nr:MAG: ROK family protein [Planctomycetota bacterium]
MSTSEPLPQGPVVGIDLGGTNIQIGIVDHKARILGRAKDKTQPESGMDAVLDRIVKGVRKAAADAQIDPDELLALGIGVPGPVDPHSGVVREAVNLRWTLAPVGELLTERLGLPVIVDNDVNVAVYGEARHGAGMGAKDLLGCWVGTGVGGALVLNGELYYGHHFSAGEIGHVLLYPQNPPGSRSVEHICSRSALADRLVHLIRTNRPSCLQEMLGDKYPRIKSKAIAEAYRKGDELTIEVVDDAADRLGSALGNFTTLLSLERIILGGGLTEALQEPFVDRVRAAVHRTAFPAVCKQVEVVASQLDDDAGVIGAALLAREHLAALTS